MNLLTDFSYLFEITTGVVAFFSRKKFKIPFYNFFFYYIVLVVLVETLGQVLRGYQINAIQLYNFYTFFEFNLLGIIYWKLTYENQSHKSISFFLVMFNIIYFLSFVFVDLQNYTVIIGAVIVSSFMILYLKELLNSSKIIFYEGKVSFWITVGFLLYYLTSIPFQAVFYIIGLESRELFYIQHFIIILTHLCFIYGLLWSKKEVS
ncbi:hypothetical protein CXF68_01710 [Tenacibaculum sp. Bg11-29]|uniref:hypothetical protein n=1 Tax=Tenacibaculum sp. Bg11-29 TaxID=2058306 RepID=UPI000C32C2D1|nr:hypothetical protein [Tenacibaculum sp. Bg11-29]PKH49480.1 hypothetical protein CXF68_01710 [Tenacibaculum sp. Bg11-29]